MGVPSVLCGVILEAKRNLCQPLGRWSGQNGYPPTHPTYLDRPSPIFDMKWNQTFWERRAGRGRRILELAKPAVQWISPVTGKCQKTRHRLKSSLRYVSFSTKKPAKFVIALQSIPIWLRGVAATTSVELSRGGSRETLLNGFSQSSVEVHSCSQNAQCGASTQLQFFALFSFRSAGYQ